MFPLYLAIYKPCMKWKNEIGHFFCHKWCFMIVFFSFNNFFLIAVFLVGRTCKNLIIFLKLPDSPWREKGESSCLSLKCPLIARNSVWLQGNVLMLLSLNNKRVELLPLWPFRSIVVVVVDKGLLLDPLARGILSAIILEMVGSFLWEKKPGNESVDNNLSTHVMITRDSLRHGPVLTLTLVPPDWPDDGLWHASYTIRVKHQGHQGGRERDTRHPGTRSVSGQLWASPCFHCSLIVLAECSLSACWVLSKGLLKALLGPSECSLSILYILYVFSECLSECSHSLSSLTAIWAAERWRLTAAVLL